MKRTDVSSRTRGQRGGFLLLLVLVTLAIGIVILGASMLTMNPFAAFNGSGADRYADPNAAPWNEGHLFINPALDAYHMGGRREPFWVQPKLKRITSYQADLFKDTQERGVVELFFSRNGDVRAEWNGKLKLKGVEYEVMHEEMEVGATSCFRGNIAPLKVYADANGKDYKKLYFITGGYGLIVGQDGKRIEGPGYVTGWINKNHTCFGKLWIASGSGEPIVYEWEAVAPTEEE